MVVGCNLIGLTRVSEEQPVHEWNQQCHAFVYMICINKCYRGIQIEALKLTFQMIGYH